MCAVRCGPSCVCVSNEAAALERGELGCCVCACALVLAPLITPYMPAGGGDSFVDGKCEPWTWTSKRTVERWKCVLRFKRRIHHSIGSRDGRTINNNLCTRVPFSSGQQANTFPSGSRLRAAQRPKYKRISYHVILLFKYASLCSKTVNCLCTQRSAHAACSSSDRARVGRTL